MFTVGITGGLASGKTTVAKLFAERGAGVIDTDAIAKQLIEPGSAHFNKIIEEFGESILSATGEIDRRLLRDCIFDSATEREKLERILHPAILAQMRDAIRSLDAAYAMVEIPLLIESGLKRDVDRVLVIDCPVSTQIDRAVRRDHVNREMAEKMISAQASREQRLEAADDIIVNDGSIETLGDRVTELHASYLEMAELKRGNPG